MFYNTKKIQLPSSNIESIEANKWSNFDVWTKWNPFHFGNNIKNQAKLTDLELVSLTVWNANFRIKQKKEFNLKFDKI